MDYEDVWKWAISLQPQIHFQKKKGRFIKRTIGHEVGIPRHNAIEEKKFFPTVLVNAPCGYRNLRVTHRKNPASQPTQGGRGMMGLEREMCPTSLFFFSASRIKLGACPPRVHSYSIHKIPTWMSASYYQGVPTGKIRPVNPPGRIVGWWNEREIYGCTSRKNKLTVVFGTSAVQHCLHGRISEVENRLEILFARNVRYNIIINTIELLQLVSKTGTLREKWWGIPKTSLSGVATVTFPPRGWRNGKFWPDTGVCGIKLN